MKEGHPKLGSCESLDGFFFLMIFIKKYAIGDIYYRLQYFVMSIDTSGLGKKKLEILTPVGFSNVFIYFCSRRRTFIPSSNDIYPSSYTERERNGMNMKNNKCMG